MMCAHFEGSGKERGQGTVEFALVTVSILAVVVGLAAMWHLFADGTLVQHAADAATHHVTGAVSAAADVFAY